MLNNFLSDFPMLAISTDHVDEEFVKKPKKWEISTISRFMVWFGLISTVFDLLFISCLLFIFHASIDLFRTAWFLESVLSEILITLSIRTRMPFYKSMPSQLLLWSTLVVSIICIGIVNAAFGMKFFEFVNIPYNIWILIGITLLFYFITTEFAKHYFFKKISA